MIYLTVQEDAPRFLWELRVQLTNLKSIGVDIKDCLILFAYKESPSKEAIAFCREFKECSIFFYQDKRQAINYIPSIKPYLIAQHLTCFPLLEKETFFYFDADVIFKEQVDFDLLTADATWWGSEASHYLNLSYIKSKGSQLFENMCSIVGVDPAIIEEKFENNSPGAQWIIKGSTAAYWRKVELDSVKLYDYMVSTQELYKQKSLSEGLIQKARHYQPIQMWTAEMWSQLWNAEYFGFAANVHKELEFCWATDALSRWEQTKIMHNAGIMGSMKDTFFYKGDYIAKDPFQEDFSHVDKNFCSSKYVDAIKNYALQK